MRNSFRHGAPALVPSPRSYTQRPREEKEQVADHGLQQGTPQLDMELTQTQPNPLHQCVAHGGPYHGGGEGTGDCYTAAATAVATAPMEQPLPHGVCPPRMGRVQRAASGREVATP